MRSCPSEDDSSATVTGVQPKMSELFATEVRATPAMNSSWYAKWPITPSVIRLIQSRRWRRVATARMPWRMLDDRRKQQ